jgi:hypothetical protein
MKPVEALAGEKPGRMSQVPGELARLWLPVLIAAAVVTIVLLIVVANSKSAWFLLGAGRGLVPEEYYHVSAFLLMLGTTFGQAVGWAGGSAIGFYVMRLVGFGSTWTTARIAMSLVYVGLAGLPISVYEVFYGKGLLGLPRVGLEKWLAANYPDAHWLLITGHPIVDWSLLPLGVVFLGVLWGFGERVRRDRVVQTVLALAVLGTSLAVALSLGIHSTLVHIHL